MRTLNLDELTAAQATSPIRDVTELSVAGLWDADEDPAAFLLDLAASRSGERPNPHDRPGHLGDDDGHRPASI